MTYFLVKKKVKMKKIHRAACSLHLYLMMFRTGTNGQKPWDTIDGHFGGIGSVVGGGFIQKIHGRVTC